MRKEMSRLEKYNNMKNKEKYYLIKAKKLALKIIKLGEKMDRQQIPFSLNYENGTQLLLKAKVSKNENTK